MISFKFGTESDHMTADILLVFKVKVRSGPQRHVMYQQWKRYMSGTDKLTEFKLGENYLSAEHNTCSRS